MVLVPYRANVIFLARLLPISVMDSLTKLIGVSNTMDDFKGR